MPERKTAKDPPNGEDAEAALLAHLRAAVSLHSPRVYRTEQLLGIFRETALAYFGFSFPDVPCPGAVSVSALPALDALLLLLHLLKKRGAEPSLRVFSQNGNVCMTFRFPVPEECGTAKEGPEPWIGAPTVLCHAAIETAEAAGCAVSVSKRGKEAGVTLCLPRYAPEATPVCAKREVAAKEAHLMLQLLSRIA